METRTNAAVRMFRPGDEVAFRALNEAWILRHFIMEEADRRVLADPVGYIIRPGGAILMAERDGVAVGTCALIAMGEGSFEIAKMTVAEKCRGLGIGRSLTAEAIAWARRADARRLYLETNNSLAPAIRTYESAGFRHLTAEEVQPSPYARANVFMELRLHSE